MTDPAAPTRDHLFWVILLRWVAFLLALLGVVWDGINIWWYLFPGPSGEWARLAVPIAAVGGIPAGGFAALFFFIARRPPTKWRPAILGTAVASAALPILLALYAHWHY